MEQASTVAGGFGTGVASILYRGGMDTMAVFPVPEISHFLRLVNVSGLPHEIIPVAGPIPMHLTMRGADSVDTEFKDSPMPLDISQLAMLRDLVVRKAEDASWVLLGGELPAIAPAAWYVDVVRALTLYHPGVKVAISATGSPLRAVVRQLAATQPHLLILTVADLEASAKVDEGSIATSWNEGDCAPLIAAARVLIAKGISEVLISLSRAESVLVTADEAFHSMYDGQGGRQGVNWRESLVAGFLSAADQGRSTEHQLSYGVAYANAAGSSWDDFIPTPDRVLAGSVRTSTLH